MPSYNPYQPMFKIRVYMGGATPAIDDQFVPRSDAKNQDNDAFMDIEDLVAWGVSLEYTPYNTNKLVFTVDKYAETLLHAFTIGTHIVFFGGYWSEDGQGVRKLFSGTCHRLITRFPDNGKISFTVEAVSMGFTQLMKDAHYYAYPDPENEWARKFVKGKKSIGIREIIDGIAEERGIPLRRFEATIDAANRVYHSDKEDEIIDVIVQDGESDWQFLRKLAANNGCEFYVSSENGKDVMNFVDTETLRKESHADIGFLYPIQGEVSGVLIDGAVFKLEDVRDEEWQRFPDSRWNRPRFLRNVTAEEDVMEANSITRTFMKFNKETGEYEHTTMYEIKTDETGNRIVYRYSLDADKVAAIDKTHPGLAKRLSTMFTKIPWSSGCADPKDETPQYTRYYYRLDTKELAQDIPVFDQPYHGWTIKATCNMDLDIVPQRTYNIRGIARYTSNDIVSSYYLQELVHKWDSSGATTEMVFKGLY